MNATAEVRNQGLLSIPQRVAEVMIILFEVAVEIHLAMRRRLLQRIKKNRKPVRLRASRPSRNIRVTRGKGAELLFQVISKRYAKLPGRSSEARVIVSRLSIRLRYSEEFLLTCLKPRVEVTST